MFLSVNGGQFAGLHPELVKFVLDSRSTDLPRKYKVDLVLVRGGFARNSGVSGNVNTATGSIEVVSEIAHYPFALQLIFGEVHHQRRGAIEQFAQYGLDEKRDVWLYTVAGHVVTKFPGDYRNRERVDLEARQSAED